MPQLRKLRFNGLDAALDEVRSLMSTGYECRGKWSLAQICRHLYLVQEASMDGYPRWMSLFAFLRPAIRRFVLPRLLSDDAPKGIRTAAIYVPAEDLDEAEEVAKFAASVARFHAYAGEFHPHPGFGRMSREAFEKVHAAHAAHHLRFLEPS